MPSSASENDLGSSWHRVVPRHDHTVNTEDGRTGAKETGPRQQGMHAIACKRAKSGGLSWRPLARLADRLAAGATPPAPHRTHRDCCECKKKSLHQPNPWEENERQKGSFSFHSPHNPSRPQDRPSSSFSPIPFLLHSSPLFSSPHPSIPSASSSCCPTLPSVVSRPRPLSSAPSPPPVPPSLPPRPPSPARSSSSMASSSTQRPTNGSSSATPYVPLPRHDGSEEPFSTIHVT